MTTILLTGANGNVSTSTIHALTCSGHRIVGLVRDKDKAAPLEALGVERRVGDLALRDYFTAYSRGWQSEVTPLVKELTGKAARRISEFARDFAGAFGKC